MENEYTRWEQSEYKRRYKPPERGSPQYQRREAQKFLKWLVRNPDANNQKLLKEAALHAREHAPEYWEHLCDGQFRLKWQQNERAKAKKREALEKEKEAN